jgi:hypothetical protein
MFVCADTRYISNESKLVGRPDPGMLAADGNFPLPETSTAMETGQVTSVIIRARGHFKKANYLIRHDQDCVALVSGRGSK